MLAGASRPAEGALATILGIGALLFAAIGVVVQLKDALNVVWEVQETEERGLWHFRPQLRAIVRAHILAVGFLLLVSLLVASGTGRGRQIRGSIHARGHSASRKPAGVVRRRDGAFRNDGEVAPGRLRGLAGRLYKALYPSLLFFPRWEKPMIGFYKSASRAWNHRPTGRQPLSSWYGSLDLPSRRRSS